MLIGLISDTHGLLRPEALQAFQGSDLIIHAGDVGSADILEELKTVAPVIAVRGNTDKLPFASSLPFTSITEVGPTIIYVLHDIQELDLDPAAAGIHVVVSGHSHKPREEVRSGVVYVNPGSAGPRRFRLPATVARLRIDGSERRVEFIDLLTGKPFNAETRSVRIPDLH
jgi:putative phosphoesterase